MAARTSPPSVTTFPPSSSSSAVAHAGWYEPFLRRPISRRASRTASQVFFTAPPVMYVCREADVEPAEPTCVSAGWMVTCVTPSSVRAICVWTVMPP